MCNCVNQAVEKFREFYPDAERIYYANVEILSGRVYSTVSVKFPNKKTPKEHLVLHNYCPTCGEKYPERK